MSLLWTTEFAREGNGLRLFMDICTYCNAGCPQCHRTNPNGLGKADWLPLVQWSIDDFKKAIRPEDFKGLERIGFVGTWGDSIMCKDIFEIVEYCVSNDTFVNIETNGSIRDEAWWWDFGVMGGRKLEVRFDVDGIDQEMHSKYRRFTDLDKILSNMQTFSQTQAIAKTQTVVFKHNQEHLEEIRKICIAHGSDVHTNVMSDRFDGKHNSDEFIGSTFTFTDENGNEDTLEKADRESLKYDPKVSGSNSDVLQEKIVCRWAWPRNEVYVKPNGDVVACCYHGNSYWKTLQTGKSSELTRNEHFKKYIDSREESNIFKHSINDIIKNKWFSKILPDSWNDDNPIPTCARNCSTRVKPLHQLREFIVANET